MSLLRYFLKRLIAALPLLFGLMTIVFFLSRLLPGDATTIFLSPTISPAVVEQLKVQFGLDRPLMDQYILWIRSALSGDLGYSFKHNASVLHVIGNVFPNTVVLGLSALMFEILFGILLSLLSFLFAGKKIETILSHTLLIVYTLPSFWIGMLLLLAFSYGLGILPSSQMYISGTATGTGSFGDLARHLVLPALAASIPAAAGFARYLRSNIAGVMNQDYMLAAKSMGLSHGRTFFSYVLPNAVAPMISLIGIEIGVLLTGVLVTETLFAWPGMGRLMVLAIMSRDYPLILGCTLIAGVVVIVGNLIADVVNAIIDPRIRLGGQ